MLSALGYTSYSKKVGERLVVEVDKDLLDCYRWFLSRAGIVTNRPRFHPHISVVRFEDVSISENWNSNSIEIRFQYDPIIHNDETYYWLAVVCPQLEQIRESLGLPLIKRNVTLSPDERHRFHLTIGNTK